MATAGILVARQPLTAPWWVYADCDGTYAASALNIDAGHGTIYLDHPGLPTQELLAVTFAVVSFAHGGPTQTWVNDEMLHLDRVRPVLRGWAIAFFVGGAILAFLLVSRLLGHWTWGVAGGLLWLAQPELGLSMQIRPDVLLSIVAFFACFLMVRAVERRSAFLLVGAAVTAGFGSMVKLPAIALLVPLLVAAQLGHPGEGWGRRLLHELRAWAGQHRRSLSATVVGWVALALALNLRQQPIHVSLSQVQGLQDLLVAVAVYLVVAVTVHHVSGNRLFRRLFDPLYVALFAGFWAGIFITGGLLVNSGMRALSSMSVALHGRGINEGIAPFSAPLSAYLMPHAMVAVFLAAMVGTAWNLMRRDWRPALWLSGAAAAGVLAAARGAVPGSRYFALAYVLAIPPALSLFQRRFGRSAPVIVALLVAYVVLPTLHQDRDNAVFASYSEHQATAATRLGNGLLHPGEAALVPDAFPQPDARWYGFVETFTDAHPNYPYRFLQDGPDAAGTAGAHGLRIRYFIGPEGMIANATTLSLKAGTYRIRALPQHVDSQTGLGAAELLAGPGV